MSSTAAQSSHHSGSHDMSKTKRNNIWTVIGASSAGTLIEWYDFYIFGSLATIIAGHYFPKGNDVVSYC
ncbi:MAG: hypothetical protein L6Q37_07110 [Bdellovibrionaceae bacterium]|nr:hypothetical protein [Pseudobdellovibrionaceae bacterium]